MADQQLVSVIIPTKNRRDLLERALRSVLQQTWKNLEIVVVDDASNDSTGEYLHSLSQNSLLQIIRNRNSKGASTSRNIALKHAKGEFIANIDDDDFWQPKRIEMLMKTFEGGFSAVCSYDKMIMNNKKVVWKKPDIITLNDLLFYNRIGNQVLTKKKYLEEIGGYDEMLPSAQDYDLWIRLVQKFGPVKTVPQVLQVVNMTDDRDRITNSDLQLEGYHRCFEKHQHLMNPSHTSYQKYRLKMAGGEKVSLLDLYRSVPSELYIKEIIRKLFL